MNAELSESIAALRSLIACLDGAKRLNSTDGRHVLSAKLYAEAQGALPAVRRLVDAPISIEPESAPTTVPVHDHQADCRDVDRRRATKGRKTKAPDATAVAAAIIADCRDVDQYRATKGRKTKTPVAATPGAIVDYPIPLHCKATRLQWPPPSLCATFGRLDGAPTKVCMSFASLAGKPTNVGQALRLCIAAYRSRMKTTEHLKVPAFQSAELSTGEPIDLAAANAFTVEERAQRSMRPKHVPQRTAPPPSAELLARNDAMIEFMSLAARLDLAPMLDEFDARMMRGELMTGGENV